MLIEVLALGMALLSGVRTWQLMVLALVLFAPAALVPPIGYALITGRRQAPDRTALFCDGVASELRAGSTLRSALLRAAESVSIDVDAVAGRGSSKSLGTITHTIATALPRLGEELEAIVEAVARSGSVAADLFDELAAVAISQEEIHHEIVVATAPARATAWFFLMAPTAFLAYQMSRGAITQMFAQPAQRLIGAIGALLYIGGVMWMASLIRRAR